MLVLPAALVWAEEHGPFYSATSTRDRGCAAARPAHPADAP